MIRISVVGQSRRESDLPVERISMLTKSLCRCILVGRWRAEDPSFHWDPSGWKNIGRRGHHRRSLLRHNCAAVANYLGTTSTHPPSGPISQRNNSLLKLSRMNDWIRRRKKKRRRISNIFPSFNQLTPSRGGSRPWLTKASIMQQYQLMKKKKTRGKKKMPFFLLSPFFTY